MSKRKKEEIQRVRITPQGQSLLSVLVITTLALLLLIGISSRIDLGQENVRRAGEFDRSVVVADNAANEVIRVLRTNEDCIATFADEPEFVEIGGSECPGLDNISFGQGDEKAVAFGRSSPDGSVEVSAKRPLALNLSESGESVDKVRLKCPDIPTGTNVGDKPKIHATVITRPDANLDVYEVGAKGLDIECDADYTDIELKDVNSGAANYVVGSINDSVLVRFRLMDSNYTNANDSVALSAQVLNGASVVAATESVEIMVSSDAGLGSDSIIAFTLPYGDASNDLSSVFDFVYFGED